MMTPKTRIISIASILNGIVGVILALIPFHAFLTVWLASKLGHYTALRLWKEVLLFFGVVLAVTALVRRPKLRRVVCGDKLFWLFGGYGLLLLLIGLIAKLTGTVTTKALAYGLLIDGRFLLFFYVALVASFLSPFLKRLWFPLMTIPAAIVVGFGILQRFVLPYDVLKHFGYSAATIKPYETVDQKLQYVRVTSTLRGANPLGAYLILPITIFWYKILQQFRKAELYVLGLLISVAVLWFTYSRSALIGTLLSCGLLTWLLLKGRRLQRFFLVALAVLVVGGASLIVVLRNNDAVQNTLFHTDEHSRSSESSNSGHIAATKNALLDIVHQPLGRGAGTAGPASVYNNGKSRISENYFLQIGQEAGVLGLGLFVAINSLIGFRLWRLRQDKLALVLFASLIGISFVNLLSHAWADDTLAYLWWGLAGVCLGTPAPLSSQNADVPGQR